MVRKYIIDKKSGVLQNKRKELREALLPLINSGSAKKKNMILCVGGRHNLDVYFITQKQHNAEG